MDTDPQMIAESVARLLKRDSGGRDGMSDEYNFSREHLSPILTLPANTPVTTKTPRQSAGPGAPYVLEMKYEYRAMGKSMTIYLKAYFEKDRDEKLVIGLVVQSLRNNEVCPQCGYYALTPKILREMDEWGMSLKKNIVEPQPFFTKAAHDFAEEIASQYGLKKVPLIRALTAHYLNHIVNRRDFQDIKKYCDHHEAKRLLETGKKSKISVPIRYLMYKKLQTFCEVWEIPHAKALEEATLFGLVLLTHKDKNLEKLKVIAESLQQYITEFAQAA